MYKILFILLLLPLHLLAQITTCGVDDFNGKFIVKSRLRTAHNNPITGARLKLSLLAEDSLFYVRAVWKSSQINERDFIDTTDRLLLKFTDGAVMRLKPDGVFVDRIFKSLFLKQRYISARYVVSKADFARLSKTPIVKIRYSFCSNTHSVDFKIAKHKGRVICDNAGAVGRLAVMR